MRFALGIEYAGDGFHGWQSQADGSGVQDAVERALSSVAAAPVRCIAAGRTDTGVHATSQIVHFDADAERPLTAWVRGVNSALPPAVGVLWAQPVAADFHARFAATARHYTYLLQNRAVRPALSGTRAGWYHRPLDREAMAKAMTHLLGTHDFSSFRAAECQARSPVRTLAVATVRASGDWLRFDFSADAFLHHMIRNIVGALVVVGSGRARPEWLAELVALRDRTRAAPTFAPGGLYFAGADYAPRWDLPATRRELPPLPSG